MSRAPDDQTGLDRLNAALADRYRIERELGAGGMATVYLAEDLKHDRKVAIKVLKPELAAVIGGERFLAEIRTTASLQHPHILPLFDSGEADGFLFYVMPFVDGESLRERLDREKQLGVEDAVRITAAVASALHYAHERGIVHRDIKPANILIHADQPVVADFGIALAISAAGGGRLTETGMSVGTPHYMSPEQASADRDVSARSDIYSLGCVLYECLAGEPPHTGANAQAVLLRILTEEPRDIGTIRKSVPTHVQQALARALEKLPADRFESADAFRRALGDASYTYRLESGPGRTAGSGRSTTAAPGRDRRIPVLVAANLLLLAALAWTLLRPRTPAGTGTDAPPHRYTIPDPDRQLDLPSVSRNGDVVYVAGTDGPTRLRVRRANDTTVVDLPNTSDAHVPTFSPDGKWIAFVVGAFGAGSIRRVEVATGNVETVYPAGVALAMTPIWSGDDRILFATQGSPGQIMAVPAVGGDAVVLSDDPGFSPRILPDGRTLLYTRLDANFTGSSVVMKDLVSGDTATLVAAGANAFWAPTGHILYGDPNGAIQALPFDLARREVTGPAVPVQQNVFHFGPILFFAVSATGTLAYMTDTTGVSLDRIEFAWLDAHGVTTPIPIEPTTQGDARISPDGRRLVYVRDDDLYLYDLAAGTSERFTFAGEPVHWPTWSADGTRIAFATRRSGGTGNLDIWVRNVDGRSPAELLYGTDRVDFPAEWLEDGTLLFVAGDTERGPWDILVLPPDSTEARVLLGEAANEWQPAVSPDGSLMSYLSDEGGDLRLYVREFPGMGGPWQVSSATVNYTVRWLPTGHSIVYQDVSRGVFVRARIEVEPPFRVDRADVGPSRLVNFINDVHPDGRILFNRPVGVVGEGTMNELHSTLVVVANWFTELRSRLRDAAR